MRSVSLSLGGGGAKSIYYLGFIRALETNRIGIDMIFALSGGAYLLCFMASKMTDKEIIKEFSKFKFTHYLSLNPAHSKSFYDAHKIESYLNSLTNNSDIKDLKYKTCITTSDFTDWNNPFKVLNWEGNLAKKTIQSGAIQPLFPLCEENGRLYSDGAFTSKYSAQDMREAGAEYIIGFYPDGMESTNIPEPFKGLAITLKSLTVLKDKLNAENEKVDLEINEFCLEIGMNGFDKAESGYEEGYRKGLKVSKDLMRI